MTSAVSELFLKSYEYFLFFPCIQQEPRRGGGGAGGGGGSTPQHELDASVPHLGMSSKFTNLFVGLFHVS